MYFQFLVHFFIQFRNLVLPTPSAASHFVPKTQTWWDVLKKQTVGVVHISQFIKGRVELAEQQHRRVAYKIQAIHRGGGGVFDGGLVSAQGICRRTGTARAQR